MLLAAARRGAARLVAATPSPAAAALRALSGAAAEAAGSSPAERDEFRAMVADFAAREVAPHAEAIDRSNAFPKAVNLWAKLGEFGLLGEGKGGGERESGRTEEEEKNTSLSRTSERATPRPR